MKCPACGNDRVFHSRARGLSERALKRIVPLTYYRCHDCDWRHARMQGAVKAISLHYLSLMGYIGGAGLIIALVAGVVLIALTFFGVPVPWID